MDSSLIPGVLASFVSEAKRSLQIASLLQDRSLTAAEAPVVIAETQRWNRAFLPMVQAALRPQIAAALAAWRADPTWADRFADSALKETMIEIVLDEIKTLCTLPAAQRDDLDELRNAVDIVLHLDRSSIVGDALEALGVAGWRALDDDRRRALLEKAPVEAYGWIWTELDATRHEKAVQEAISRRSTAPGFIRSIGARWEAVDPTLRARLLNFFGDFEVHGVLMCASLVPFMSNDERTTFVNAMLKCVHEGTALPLLEKLGAAGRMKLTAEQRAAIEARVPTNDSWHMGMVRALRAADIVWTDASDEDRRTMLSSAKQGYTDVSELLSIVGVAGWRALPEDERRQLAEVVRRTPDALFRCPPALWADLAGDDLPPATDVPWNTPERWRIEDADADLSALSAAHQALVLALAPWRPEDITPDSARMQRLSAAWNEMSAHQRVSLVLSHPHVLPMVAAAARVCGGPESAAHAVGETSSRIVKIASYDLNAAWRAVVASDDDMARVKRFSRPEFPPSSGDVSDVRNAFRTASLLLDDSPLADVALVAIADRWKWRKTHAPLIVAALAPQIAAALAAWRADPTWAERIAGAGEPSELINVVLAYVGVLGQQPAALSEHSNALRDAVTIVVRHDHPEVASLCLNALGAAGWAALEADQRTALLTLASPGDLGWIWGALDEKQRTAAVHAALHAPQVLEDTAAQRLAAQARAAAEAWTEEAQRARSREAAANLLLAADKVRQAALFAEDSAPLSRAKAVRAAESAAETALSASASKCAEDAARAVEFWTERLRRRLFDATSDVQQAETASAVGRLIERIGADGWKATSPELRERLIDAVARFPDWVPVTTPAWPGMTADERTRLATAVIDHGGGSARFLLEQLGADAREMLTDEQVATLKDLSMAYDAQRGAESRLERIDRQRPPEADDVLRDIRDIGVAGWRALPEDERRQLAESVRRRPSVLFRCPPALWEDLAGDALPPATDMTEYDSDYWRAEDADADLGNVSKMHEALVLALAPWRIEDVASDSVRMQRLSESWHALTADERAALVTGRPFVLATVAAAARVCGGPEAARAAVGETVSRVDAGWCNAFAAVPASIPVVHPSPRFTRGR